MEYAIFFGFILLAYIIGSIPFGYILVKVVTGQDIREVGSGSTGATNVKRVLGAKGFFTVMLLDGFKGILTVLLAKFVEIKFGIFPELSLLPPLTAVAIILGHSKSIFLKFTGGKSVACGAGSVIGLDWHAGLVTFVIWASTVYFSRYVSLGSIIALVLSPLWMYLFKQPLSYVIYCFIGAIYVVWLHRENISRLIQGNENKVR